MQFSHFLAILIVFFLSSEDFGECQLNDYKNEQIFIFSTLNDNVLNISLSLKSNSIKEVEIKLSDSFHEINSARTLKVESFSKHPVGISLSRKESDTVLIPITSNFCDWFSQRRGPFTSNLFFEVDEKALGLIINLIPQSTEPSEVSDEIYQVELQVSSVVKIQTSSLNKREDSFSTHEAHDSTVVAVPNHNVGTSLQAEATQIQEGALGSLLAKNHSGSQRSTSEYQLTAKDSSTKTNGVLSNLKELLPENRDFLNDFHKYKFEKADTSAKKESTLSGLAIEKFHLADRRRLTTSISNDLQREVGYFTNIFDNRSLFSSDTQAYDNSVCRLLESKYSPSVVHQLTMQTKSKIILTSSDLNQSQLIHFNNHLSNHQAETPLISYERVFINRMMKPLFPSFDLESQQSQTSLFQGPRNHSAQGVFQHPLNLLPSAGRIRLKGSTNHANILDISIPSQLGVFGEGINPLEFSLKFLDMPDAGVSIFYYINTQLPQSLFQLKLNFKSTNTIEEIVQSNKAKNTATGNRRTATAANVLVDPELDLHAYLFLIDAKPNRYISWDIPLQMTVKEVPNISGIPNVEKNSEVHSHSNEVESSRLFKFIEWIHNIIRTIFVSIMATSILIIVSGFVLFVADSDVLFSLVRQIPGINRSLVLNDCLAYIEGVSLNRGNVPDIPDQENHLADQMQMTLLGNNNGTTDVSTSPFADSEWSTQDVEWNSSNSKYVAVEPSESVVRNYEQKAQRQLEENKYKLSYNESDFQRENAFTDHQRSHIDEFGGLIIR